MLRSPMQTLSIWIFPSLPPGSQQGFNTLGITIPQQLGFNCEKTPLWLSSVTRESPLRNPGQRLGLQER